MSGVREIPLSKGRVAIVDEEDYEMLSHWSWWTHSKGYAAAHCGSPVTFMHRVLMLPDPGEQVDHINGDGLDNRKANLRICTNQENHFNMRPCAGKSSPYKGVSWESRDRKWAAAIKHHQRKIHIGRYRRERDAAAAYDLKAQELFGEFARLNLAGP